MRKIITCLLLAIATPVFAQDSVEDLIKEGVTLHDEGNFEQAIKAYQKVLAIEKDNLEAKYEIALSYTGMKEHTKAIEYAEELIKSKTDYVAKGYHLKGMNLDYSGKKKEAIAAFKKGIKASPEYTTLYYSVAITSMAIEEYKDAEKALKDGLEINPNHAASNYMLAVLHQDERPKSLLALYYFLILEPEGQRSNAAYNLILSQHKIGVEVKDSQSITVSIKAPDENDEFAPAELMLSMLEASKNMEENKAKSDFELFSENTRSFFMVLGELQENGKNKGFWWDNYVRFFYDLARNDEMYEAFTYYISQNMNYTVVENWMLKNPDKVAKFEDWVLNYKR